MPKKAKPKKPKSSKKPKSIKKPKAAKKDSKTQKHAKPKKRVEERGFPAAFEDALKEAAGEEVLSLVKVLRKTANLSEFKLAEILKKEINTVRNMLYRLHERNLVSFIRKKDKKKGWYIYYWTFNPKRVYDLIVDLKKKRLDRLRERFARETNSQFYACTKGCIRLDFDQATDYSFKCPECGSLLELENNEEKKKKLDSEIKQLEEDLKV